MTIRAMAWTLSLLVVAPPVLAQTHRASIRGVVTDQARTPMAGVRLTLIDTATNEARTAISGSDGQFSLSSLPPGQHRLELEAAGHKRTVRAIALAVNQELWIDVALEVGPISEVVFVTAPLVPLDNDSAALGTVIDQDLVTDLPLDGRNFLDLALLVPGASPAAQGSASSVRNGFAVNVNGAREDANAFLLDGVYNIDPKLNTVGVRPPVDAVREFEVLTGAADASFGRNAGAQINVITRSGSNSPAGAVYEFFRSDALDARPVFAPRTEPAPDYSRHQFGGALGGPIVRDRTFFFGDYEGTRRREGVTRLTTVPTEQERRGDFSASARPPVNPFTGQPFPGGQLPAALLNPVGVAIAALYPRPNRDGTAANFVSSPVLQDDEDHFDVRVDHGLTAGGTLTLRYSFGDRRLFQPFSGPSFAQVPGFGTRVPRRAQNMLAGHTRVFGASLVNDLRVAWSRVSAGAFPENSGTSLNRTVGLPELSDDPRDFGLSFITVSGFSPLGDEVNNPQHSSTGLLQVVDTATWAKGRHLWKFGADFRATRQRAYRDVQARGFLTFADRGYTGNALADLLLGLPILTGGATLDNPQNLRTESLGLFAHDSVRLSPSLTLSAGLRYELTSPPVDADDRANIYDPATGTLVRVGTNGIPRAGYRPDRDNLSPRVGLAWTPDRAGRTVVRGAYGIYYDQSSLAPGEALYFSAPYFDFRLYFPLPGLPLTLDNPFPALFPLALPQSALTFQRNLETGLLHHWNVNLQRQLGGARALEVAYVGSRGRSLVAARDINQPDPSPAPFNPRPLPHFDDITIVESRATSRYDALQLQFQQRLHRGLSVLAAYTFSRSEDDASSFFSSAGDANFPQDSRSLAGEYARSNFDVRHRFSLAFGYELPVGPGRRWTIGHGVLAAVLADWEIQGILSVQSGRPFTAALLPEIDNSNTGRSVLGFGANDRPNLVGDPAVTSPGPDRWFNTAAFAFPPFGSFGNVPRNSLEGPGFQNVNLALLKHLRLSNRARLQLRLEAFNLLNRANFDLPDNFLGSPTFGRILSAQSPRRIQLGAKLVF